MSNPYRTNCAVQSTAATRASWYRRYIRSRQLRTLERLTLRQELINEGLRGAWRNTSKQHRRYRINPYKLSLWRGVSGVLEERKVVLPRSATRKFAEHLAVGVIACAIGLLLATAFNYVATAGLHGIRWFISL